jgi:hypothetical protein
MNTVTDKNLFLFIGDTWRNCGDTAGQTNALQNDQAFSAMMKNNYATDFSENQALMNNLTGNLGSIIAAGPGQQGFTPQELAAQNSQAINAAAAGNQKAQVAIGENAAKGSATPGIESGITQAERSAAATTEDTGLANTEANITNANYATGRQNYWNAVGEQEKAPGAFEEPSTEAANAVTGANKVTGEQANANEQNSMGTQLLGLGEGLASNAATAFAGGCWVAAEVFDGWDDPRVSEARNFIFNVWAKESFIGSLVAKLYLKIGKHFAKIVRQHAGLRRLLKPIFEIAVRKNQK